MNGGNPNREDSGWRSGRGRIPLASEPMPDELGFGLQRLLSASSLAELIEACAAAHPERLALQTPAGDYDYRMINEGGNAVARRLSALAPQPGRVMLWLDDPGEITAAILGSIKAGWCFVSRHPQAPNAYNAQLIKEVRPAVILVGAGSIPRVREIAPEEVLVWSCEEILREPVSANPNIPVPMDAVIRLVFTSGSTGGPKGVEHDQKCMLHEAFSAMAGADYEPGVRMLQLSSLAHVNGSDWLLYMLMTGGTLSCYPLRDWGLGRLPSWLREKEVTRFVSVPSVFRRFLHETDFKPDDLSTLRVVHLGGEPVRPEDVREFQKVFPPTAKLIANIGSTEGGSFARRVFTAEDSLPGRRVSLGRPHPGLEVELWNENNEPMGPGEVGEIVIRSRGVARGYFENESLTKAHFAPDTDPQGWRRFRTGDLAEWGQDGLLYSLGRRDQQVQINGQRVEPMEVEMVIAEHPFVDAVAVKAWPDPFTGARLTAYYTVGSSQELSTTELQQWLSVRLPPASQPRRILRLENLPATESGKIDRQALSDEAPTTDSSAGLPFAPESLEQQVAEKFAEIFGRDHVGVDESFFALGGDSLRATELGIALEADLGWGLPYNALFRAPTPRGLAQLLMSAPRNFDNLVPLGSGSGDPPVFFIHGWGGTVTHFRPLAEKLTWDTSLLGVQGNDHGGDHPRPESISELVRHYAALIHTCSPHGPFRLVGYSAGGVLAYLVAVELQKRDLPVAGVITIDSRPNGVPRWMRVVMIMPYFLRRAWHHAGRWLTRPREEESYMKGRTRAAGHLARIVANPVAPGTDYYADLLRFHRLPRAKFPVSVIKCAATREALSLGWRYLVGGRVKSYKISAGHYQVFAPENIDELVQACQQAWEDVGES